MSTRWRGAVCGLMLSLLGVGTSANAQTNFVLRSFGNWSQAGTHPAAELIQAADGKIYGTAYSGGRSNQGILFRFETNGSGYEALKHFGAFPSDGGRPQAALLEVTGGLMFGTTTGGGGSNAGTIFSLSPGGSNYLVLHEFTGATNGGGRPQAKLLEGLDGGLYGTTAGGGRSNFGTIFRLNQDGSDFNILHQFVGTNGAFPRASLVQSGDGSLFGITTSGGLSNQGSIFRIGTNGSGFTILKHFTRTNGDARYPQSLLLANDGRLYGTARQSGTNGLGAVFALETSGANFSLLHQFAGGTNDGAGPRGGLIDGGDSSLYGTTFSGGASNQGVIFRVRMDGNDYAVLHHFADSASDSRQALAGLLRADHGALYGTSFTGGSNDVGTVFHVDREGTNHVVVWNFSRSGGELAYPNHVIHGGDGFVYGTAEAGGYGDGGGVFRLNSAGDLTVLHEFGPGDGRIPIGLITASDGYLYGATATGGATNLGTIFKLGRDGSDYAVLHHFNGTNGSQPLAPPIEASDGLLYGATYWGGSVNVGSAGTLFRLQRDGGAFTNIVQLGSGSLSSSMNPPGGVIEGADGFLYATAFQTVFRVNKSGGSPLTLRTFSFSDTNGWKPMGPLYRSASGHIYGATMGSGGGDSGVMFRSLLTGFTFLRSFNTNGTEGLNPWSGLVARPDGRLYGSAYAGGTNGLGILFLIGTNGGEFNVLKYFAADGSEGAHPQGPLALGSDGTFYGTTTGAGDGGFGTVFRFAPAPHIERIAANHGAEVTVLGAEGFACELQSTTNLMSAIWESAGTNTFGTDGRTIFLDPDAANVPATFYRVRSLP